MDTAVQSADNLTSILDGGKRVHDHFYIHTSLLKQQNKIVREAVKAAQRTAKLRNDDFNVIRFARKRREIALLKYKGFFEDPFPCLEAAYLVDLTSNSVQRTDFSSRANPPILHRKELLLSSTHPERSKFSELTKAIAARGLFVDSANIGNKKQWEDRLAKHCVQIVGHVLKDSVLVAESDNKNAEVERHRTAIARDRLSAPMQALARHGLLSAERSVLDYGCGQGDDVRALKAGGIQAIGWDPHYAPRISLEPCDIVNVGFVLNVIEEPSERVATIRRAFELARECLAVAVMVIGKGAVRSHKAYGDGVLTGRGTFQKYYQQSELKEFLESALRVEAIAVGPGIFFVFKDKLLEQRFLLDRQRRAFFPLAVELRPPLDRPTLAERRLEALRPILDQLWQKMFELGRPIAEEELPPDLLLEIRTKIGSLRRAERLGRSPESLQKLAASRDARREDLLVYFGLNLFNGRTRYSTLPPELQRDISAFFGNAKSSFEEAKALLFSVGKPEVIDEACRQASAQGLGYLIENESLQIQSALVNQLPPALRCYVGCAAKLYGDFEAADVIKVHVRSGKLTLQFYDDFDSSPLPRLRERVKINMRDQKIDFFQYANRAETRLLFLKSRYMSSDQPGYDCQKEFDDALDGLGIFDFSGYGPSGDEFYLMLENAGYVVRGFNLERIG